MSNRERIDNTYRKRKQETDNTRPEIQSSEYKRLKAEVERNRRIRKRKARNRAIAVIIVALIILGIIGFLNGGSATNKIVGTWDYDTVTVYRFDKAGQGALELPNASYDFSYSAQADRIIIDFEDDKVTDRTYTYTVNNDELTLSEVGTTDTVYVLKKKS